MNSFWSLRSEREKVLIVTASAVFVCLLAYLAFVRPAINYRQSAYESYRAATQDLSIVSGLADQVKNLSGSDARSSKAAGGIPRIEATAAARALGLGITRIQPMDDRSVSFWFDDVSGPDLFQWMIGLNGEHGFDIQRVDIQKATDGPSVRAQVVIRSAQ